MGINQPIWSSNVGYTTLRHSKQEEAGEGEAANNIKLKRIQNEISIQKTRKP